MNIQNEQRTSKYIFKMIALISIAALIVFLLIATAFIYCVMRRHRHPVDNDKNVVLFV